MNRTLKAFLQFALFLSIGLAIVAWIYVKISGDYTADCLANGGTECSFLKKIKGDFATVRLPWIGLIIGLFMLSNISRATRWTMLVRALGYRPSKVNAFLTVMIGYLANMGLPRMGEFVRAGSFSRYEKIPVDRVMGTIVTDRIFDVLALLIFFFLALIVEFDMFGGYLARHAVIPAFGGIAGGWLFLVGLGLFFLGIFYRRRLIGIFPAAIAMKIRGLMRGLWEGISSVKKLHSPVAFAGHSALIWILYFSMSWLCFYAFPPTSALGVKEGLIVFVFGSLGMVIPTPGGLGSYHYLVMVALGLYGISEADSFSFAFILYLSVAILCNVLFGLLALILLPLYNRNRHQPVQYDGTGTN